MHLSRNQIKLVRLMMACGKGELCHIDHTRSTIAEFEISEKDYNLLDNIYHDEFISTKETIFLNELRNKFKCYLKDNHYSYNTLVDNM